MKNPKYLFHLILLFIVLLACTESTNEDNESNYMEGYIVSSFVCEKTNTSGQAIGENTKRGYGILLKDSKNTNNHWAVDFYTFKLPKDLFDFPQELLFEGSNGDDCGPVFFPEKYGETYKIKFQYKILSASEKEEFVCGPCTNLHQAFIWENYKEVSLENVTKL